MKIKHLLCFAAAGLLAVSCIDDSYNLDDIDTTSRVDVKDLVIPVNFGDITLSDVIKIDEEDSDIEIVEIDGERYYVFTRTGSFDSDPIFIKNPVATTPTLESKQATLYKNSDGVFEIYEMGDDFSFTCNDVDKSIVEISKVKVNDIAFSTTLNVAGTYTDLRFHLPAGMTGSATDGAYDPATGVWTIKSLTITKPTTIAYVANSIDFTKNDFVFADHKFDFTSNFSVLGGTLTAEGQTVDFKVDFNLSNLDVLAIDGKIQYEIEGMDIESISLASLPSFLEGDETNLILANPMICLQTNNPLADDLLSFSAGLTLTANRDNAAPVAYTSDTFSVGYGYGVEGPYNTILSPVEPADAQNVPTNFRQNYKWTEFAGLGEVLAGNGLPKTIGVTAVSPMIPEQTVKDFALGREITGVAGNYELYAPLALAKDSKIVYSDTKDGWGEDVNYLTITQLTITAEGTNNTPLDAEIVVYPINSKGERIDAKITSSTLAANATEPLTITLTGVITDLDGVEFQATVVSQDDSTLSPDQTIIFKDIRARVTGYYQREL